VGVGVSVGGTGVGVGLGVDVGGFAVAVGVGGTVVGTGVLVGCSVGGTTAVRVGVGVVASCVPRTRQPLITTNCMSSTNPAVSATTEML
jgi:hypothetical protein